MTRLINNDKIWLKVDDLSEWVDRICCSWLIQAVCSASHRQRKPDHDGWSITSGHDDPDHDDYDDDDDVDDGCGSGGGGGGGDFDD